MLIGDAIKTAPSEHAVLFLVTSYIESLRHFHRTTGIPEYVVRLPLEGSTDLTARTSRICAGEALAPEAVLPVMEAFTVFNSAMKRLETHDI